MTIIEYLDNDFLGNYLYMKREDLLPFSFGGNKARKAQLFFDEIDEGDVDYVVTYGNSSSNHCRVIANACAKRNLSCKIISPIEDNDDTFNRKLIRMLGADLHICDIGDVSDVIQQILNDLRVAGFNPYFIEGGGHGYLGTHAYVQCYNEILEYEKSSSKIFDYIFHASGTGTTQAGLICGKILNNSDVSVVGISIARNNPHGTEVVYQSVREYLARKGISEDSRSHVEFVDDYTLGGYGIGGAQIDKLIERVFCKYGVALNTVYTGKAFWGMEQYLQNRSISGKNILFINTGGIPNVFDDLEKKR